MAGKRWRTTAPARRPGVGLHEAPLATEVHATAMLVQEGQRAAVRFHPGGTDFDVLLDRCRRAGRELRELLCRQSWNPRAGQSSRWQPAPCCFPRAAEPAGWICQTTGGIACMADGQASGLDSLGHEDDLSECSTHAPIPRTDKRQQRPLLPCAVASTPSAPIPKNLLPGLRDWRTGLNTASPL